MWLIFQIALIALWYVPAFSAVPALVIFAPALIWVALFVLGIVLLVISLAAQVSTSKRRWR